MKSLRQAAGRSGEVAYLTYERLRWDPKFQCVQGEFAQIKSVKVKIAAFVAGATRHDCWFVDMFDMLATNRLPVHDPELPTWVFPELHRMDSASAGGALGDYIRCVMPPDRTGAKQVRGIDVVAQSLPDKANAAGVRVGAANELFATMPDAFATTSTGHAMLQESAFYEYVKSLIANAIPGAVVLGGWPPFAWGQRGMGPVPANLDALSELVLPGCTSFDAIIDEVFGLDSASPPMV